VDSANCSGSGDVCAGEDLVADTSVFAGSQVRAGVAASVLCNSQGDICAGEDLVADVDVFAGSQVIAGIADDSTNCNGDGDVCAGDSLVADASIFAGAQVRASQINTSNCVGSGDVCAGDDLVSDDDVYAGSGCVRNEAGSVIVGSCPSDARLKRDIAEINPVLAKLVALQPVTFDWRRDEFPELQLATEPGMGLIAQEVETILPVLVSVDGNGYKRVHYERLPILMLQGIRELKTENDGLREQLAAERQRNDSLEARLAAIEAMLAAPPVQAQR
jgi:hypothetical protein